MPFLQVAKRIASPVPPQRIHPPRYRMLGQLALYWLWLFVTALLSFSLLLMITVPVFGSFIYYYYLFSRKWRACGYSAKLLHISTLVLWIIFALGAGPLRKWIGAALMAGI